MQGWECASEESCEPKYEAWNIYDAALEKSTGLKSFEQRIDYGKQTFKGSWANTDRFSIDDRGDFWSDVDIFYIKEDAGFDQPLSGIIGLAKPDEKMLIAPNTQRTEKKTFLESWQQWAAEKRDDEEKVFSTMFTDNFPSVAFGKINEKKYREDEEPVDLLTNKDFFWSLSAGGIRIGESQSREYGFTPDEQAIYMKDGGVYTIFDTAAKDIMISDLWYESFVAAFMEASGVKDFSNTNGQLLAKCTSNFPNLYFLVNGHWLVVLPEHYKVETSGNNMCRLRFSGIDAGFNIYGLPIFVDYYVSHHWIVEEKESEQDKSGFITSNSTSSGNSAEDAMAAMFEEIIANLTAQVADCDKDTFDDPAVNCTELRAALA